VVHEINNPVGTILLAASHALESVDKPRAQKIVENALRMLGSDPEIRIEASPSPTEQLRQPASTVFPTNSGRMPRPAALAPSRLLSPRRHDGCNRTRCGVRRDQPWGRR
jgi:hypothetical protein